MALKLTPARPDDRYVRVHYTLTEQPDGAFKAKAFPAEGAPKDSGWIEFWADDAKACKSQLKQIAGGFTRLQERKDKRKEELSDVEAAAEIDEYITLLVEGISHRVKDWHLVLSDGTVADAQVTFENAKAIFGDEDNDLRDVMSAFLGKQKIYPERANKKSSS